MALLSITQQQNIKPISPNWAGAAKVSGGKSNFDQLAEEIEDGKLVDKIGFRFLQDLRDAENSEPNDFLMLGGVYMHNNIEHRIKGLNYVLAYMIYSEYVRASALNDSFTGLVRKSRNESETAKAGDVKAEQLNAQQLAIKEFKNIELYLNCNVDLYPLWRCTTPKKIYTYQMKGLRKTKK